MKLRMEPSELKIRLDVLEAEKLLEQGYLNERFLLPPLGLNLEVLSRDLGPEELQEIFLVSKIATLEVILSISRLRKILLLLQLPKNEGAEGKRSKRDLEIQGAYTLNSQSGTICLEVDCLPPKRQSPPKDSKAS